MSNLTPSVVALDSGLNLQTAKIIAPPGSVLDTLNYEQVDFQGQKRIDGYQRYDGSMLPTLDEYYVVTFSSAPTWSTSDVIVSATQKVVGILVALSGTTASVAIIDSNLIPTAGRVLYTIDDTGTLSSGATVESCVTGTESGVNAEEHYQNLLSYSAVLRSKIESLPGGIIGLQWFRDRLYAVADVAMVFLEGTSPQIFPEDVLTVSGGSEARVLDSYTGAEVRVVFLDTQDTSSWYTEGANVSRGVDVVGVTGGDQYEIPVEAVASFFESRTEQQVIDEDETDLNYGWRFRHLGWLVYFNNGYSLFGSLPSSNQNIEGLGVQGPTSIVGNNGRPLILLQKVSITNGQAQVNGWKSTQTPGSYLLDPDDLTDVDSDAEYADGYISWDGTTGVVTALGASGGTLVEYPATATVEVVV